MSDNQLQIKSNETIKEKSQYMIAFAVIAMMLYFTGLPMLVILFFGILAYFIWKIIAAPSHNLTQKIFEFYLMANEILRDDERRWYGFEMQDVITRGERILQNMSSAPPLIYFTLGALYNKIGDHQTAAKHLSHILENENWEEKKCVYPTPELREYVKILRKIEREPAEAPQTSAAVRALERARRNRGPVLLENSRLEIQQAEFKKAEVELEQNHHKELSEQGQKKAFVSITTDSVQKEIEDQVRQQVSDENKARTLNGNHQKNDRRKKAKSGGDVFANRKTISEVLHDIYDAKP